MSTITITEYAITNKLNCLSRILVARIPEHFTGPCTLALAIERYILVCMPFQATTLLTKRKRVIAYMLLLCAMMGLSVFEMTFSLGTGRQFDLCVFFPSGGIYNDYTSSHSSHMEDYYEHIQDTYFSRVEVSYFAITGSGQCFAF